MNNRTKKNQLEVRNIVARTLDKPVTIIEVERNGCIMVGTQILETLTKAKYGPVVGQIILDNINDRIAQLPDLKVRKPKFISPVGPEEGMVSIEHSDYLLATLIIETEDGPVMCGLSISHLYDLRDDLEKVISGICRDQARSDFTG